MSRKKSSGAGGLLAGALLTFFGLLVLVGAVLRETPLFWRNDGGYPVELRELVYDGFYAALGVYFLLLAGAVVSGSRLLRQNSRSGAVLLLACGFNLLLAITVFTIIAWNNIENLLQGLPFHHHPA
jgi:hypothetical protein